MFSSLNSTFLYIPTFTEGERKVFSICLSFLSLVLTRMSTQISWTTTFIQLFTSGISGTNSSRVYVLLNSCNNGGSVKLSNGPLRCGGKKKLISYIMPNTTINNTLSTYILQKIRKWKRILSANQNRNSLLPTMRKSSIMR